MDDSLNRKLQTSLHVLHSAFVDFIVCGDQPLKLIFLIAVIIKCCHKAVLISVTRVFLTLIYCFYFSGDYPLDMKKLREEEEERISTFRDYRETPSHIRKRYGGHPLMY